jgi:hypothetical protein
MASHIISSVNIGDGEFLYVRDFSQDMYKSAFRALRELEMWDFVKSHQGPFETSSDERIHTIFAFIQSNGYEHSGTSFALTLRAMQFLALHGESAFREAVSPAP